MTSIKLPYVLEYIDRHGKVRRYFRRKGSKQIALPGISGSDEFMAAYQAALAKSASLEIGAGRFRPKSIDELIASYLKNDAFTKALAPETQRMRRNILDRFRTNHGAKLVATIEPRHIVGILEKKKPYAQKNWLKTIRGLMLFAIKENFRVDDPTARVSAAKPPVKSKGHMTWGDAQIAAYRERHPIGSTARLAIELLLNVAAWRGDAHKLGVQMPTALTIRHAVPATSRPAIPHVSILYFLFSAGGAGEAQLFDRLLKLRTPFWSETRCHLRRAIDFA